MPSSLRGPRPLPSVPRPATQATRERLMDAAEALFAEHGFHGVSVREITERAGSRLADVNDHFGGKEGLFKDLITRRASVVNAARDARLAALPVGAPAAETVRAWVEAFSRPLLEQAQQGPGWRNYLRLIARLSPTRSGVLVLVADQFNPVALRFVARITELLPHSPAPAWLHGYQFMVACAMSVFADNLRLDSLTDSAVRSSDFERNHAHMVDFVVHGLLGLASAPQAGASAPPATDASHDTTS